VSDRLLSLPLAVLAVAMLGVTVAITVWAARRTLPTAQAADSSSPVLPSLHAAVSTVYTVLLAFVVVIVWQQFSDADSRVETEAIRLSNVLRDSAVFSDADRTQMHDSVLAYVRLASTREWDSMSEGKGADATTNQAYEHLWDVAYHITPAGFNQESFYRELLSRLNELGAARRSRLLSAQTSVSWVLWSLLLGGAALVLYLSLMLPTGSDDKARTVALVTTGCVITLTLFVIFVFDHPYTGSVRVDPGPLLDLLSR
jgi:Protein of unknown function (DUF4239)